MYLIIIFCVLALACSFRPLQLPRSARLHSFPLLHSSTSGNNYALLFDCDGVIVETEELHRLAYNAAFEKFALRLPDGSPVVWDVHYYDILQNTGKCNSTFIKLISCTIINLFGYHC